MMLMHKNLDTARNDFIFTNLGSVFQHFFVEEMFLINVPTRKLTWQWKTHHLKMYFLVKIDIFQCHARFQGCIF